MIWARAEGCRVTLADGRELLDLTGGFGVAALGHRNPGILEAWREQTNGRFEAMHIPGGHFFIAHARKAVLETIRATLL